MASTNKTTNYQLSQFQSSDIPAWLTDYNGDMQKIDAGIHAAKVQADGAASGVSILQTTVSGKQDRLDFDASPIAGSTNPVTSGGIYNALQNAQIQTDAVPTEGSTKAVQSGGVYTALQNKQDKLTFDSTPTANSNNPVTSGGVYNAITGSSHPSFNSQGNFTTRIGSQEPGFRYVYIPFNRMFIGAPPNKSITAVAGAWVTASDATVPSMQKVYYLSGNPFNLGANNRYPITNSEMLGLVSYDLGSGNALNNNGENTACYIKMFYVSDEDKTYISLRMNNPSTASNSVLRNTVFFGDLSYSG